MPNENKLDLRFNIAGSVQLQFVPGNEEERFYVKLLGYNAGKSIIVTKPVINGSALKVDIGQQFIVRLVSGHSAQGFTAYVLNTSKLPYAHMHLTYPDNLESTEVRKADRIDCKLIVSVKKIDEDNNEVQGKSASMSNLSTAGARLTTNEMISEKGEKITIQCKVTVAETSQYLNITGVTRRITEHENTDIGKFDYGVEFVIPNETEKVLLHAFIYEQMLNI